MYSLSLDSFVGLCMSRVVFSEVRAFKCYTTSLVVPLRQKRLPLDSSQAKIPAKLVPLKN